MLELKDVRFSGAKIVGPRRDELADELTAFANTNDGVLVLGVDDATREITGIPHERLDRVEGFVREVLNDSIEPPLGARILRLMLPDSAGALRPVLRVDVPRSLFVHKGPGGSFQRIGSSKRELSPELLARLFQQRSQVGLVRFEEQPVPGTSFETLSKALWQRFVRSLAEPPQNTLEKLGALVRDVSGALRASVAGVLMAAETPDTHLVGAVIEAVCYRGSVRDGKEQLDALTVRGPLDEQVRQAMAFLRRNQRVAATKSPARIETPQFSERAVFEAIVNAVAHRDYSIYGSKIRFFMFEDRLEIYSPGALPNTVTVESLPLRQATRNETVTRLLALCPVPETTGDVRRSYYLERRGEGVPIIVRESEELSGKTPVYRLIDGAELLLTIFAAVPGSGSAGAASLARP